MHTKYFVACSRHSGAVHSLKTVKTKVFIFNTVNQMIKEEKIALNLAGLVALEMIDSPNGMTRSALALVYPSANRVMKLFGKSSDKLNMCGSRHGNTISLLYCITNLMLTFLCWLFPKNGLALPKYKICKIVNSVI